jgi:hypothetical protein
MLNIPSALRCHYLRRVYGTRRFQNARILLIQGGASPPYMNSVPSSYDGRSQGQSCASVWRKPERKAVEPTCLCGHADRRAETAYKVREMFFGKKRVKCTGETPQG